MSGRKEGDQKHPKTHGTTAILTSEEEAVKVIRDGSFKIIVAISCMTVIFGLAGAIFAGRTNSASFLSISLSAVCSVAVTCLIGIRILVNRICRK